MKNKKKTSADNGGPQEKTDNKIFGIDNIISQLTLRCKVATWLDNQLDRSLRGPAIYLLYDKDELLYIGSISTNRTIKKRLSEHLAPRTLRYSDKMGWFVWKNLPESRDWDLVVFTLDSPVLEVEKSLIKELKPTINHKHTGRPAAEANQWEPCRPPEWQIVLTAQEWYSTRGAS